MRLSNAESEVRVRLFIATSLPPDLKENIGRVVSPLRGQIAGGSWPRSETYHLTYEFLDEQPPELVPRLEAALRDTLAGFAAFNATVGSSGFFPSPKRPRVGWLALEPREEFAAIAGRVRNVVRGAGLQAESRAFVPHLTIVRVKEAWRETETTAFAAALSTIAGSSFLAKSVSIYESRLGSGGATHTELKRVELG